MTAVSSTSADTGRPDRAAALNARLAAWRARYPTLPELEAPARRRLPYFAWDFLQGGTGTETCRERNIAAFEAVRVAPRYGVDVSRVDTSATLFGRRYAAPLVIGAVGMDGMIWPGATTALARTAQAEGIAYSTGTMATAPMETVAEIAPDSFWFQLYGLPGSNHRTTFDLVRRAGAAGAHALIVTLDIPRPAKRNRDLRNGLTMPFRIRPRMMAAAAMRPHWLAAIRREGMPAFANMIPYCGASPTREDLAAFVQRERAGAFSWELVARVRETFPGPVLVKGVLHPADAERAVELGVDGIVVSNHGGRQFDAAAAPIDVLPAIRAAAGDSTTILVDSGVMFGVDILKALACGADGVMVGRAFMLGLAALGPDGAHHVARTLIEDYAIALAQCGLVASDEARSATVRHPNAWTEADFAGFSPPTSSRVTAP
ncbi:alpha-hydroxy acid oxidase [Amorphus orientalis]|uniref:L-lactate dehydrogenase (Cytochrome) n=1 Tax=Amorphus orientalis TaxID=649198 RepID=A0AAE3VMC1_9HYPH|nr:alpha-hydroxy acid oxidase [Amorphus orientalis]MDQ0314583.1 L-lactate dehydrogenase (cytochrome) [Amorphus orientalis]